MNELAPQLAQARSFLFVPGDRPERIAKALASGAHAVIVDLEDAVAPEHKPGARAALAEAAHAAAPQQRQRMLVRINAPGSDWHDADLALLRAMATQPVGAVMLPKAESVVAIAKVNQAAQAPVLPLLESAEGLHALDLLARAPGVLRLAFGHLDFQLDLGLQCGPDEAELDCVRLALVLASRRAGLPAPVDGVTAALDDDARLAADVARSRRFGFGAKLCIHPRQLEAVHRGLDATPEQRDWARRVLAASQSAAGAFRLDGQMIDAPVLLRARALLAG